MWKCHQQSTVNTYIPDFFLKKDYSKDVAGDSASIILEKIDTLRNPISEMNKEDQKKVIKYLQNLTKLVNLYN